MINHKQAILTYEQTTENTPEDHAAKLVLAISDMNRHSYQEFMENFSKLEKRVTAMREGLQNPAYVPFRHQTQEIAALADRCHELATEMRAFEELNSTAQAFLDSRSNP